MTVRADDYFFSPWALRRNFRRFHSHKRSRACRPTYRAHAELIGLIQNYETLTQEAVRAVREDRFQLGAAQKLTICVDKHRTIHNFSWLDTFMLYHLACSIEEASAALLPACLYSYRKGFSAYQAIKRASDFIRNGNNNCMVVRRDVENFGEQMKHSEIMKDLQRFTSTGAPLLRLMEQICRFAFVEKDATGINQNGLPGGHYLQLVCENLYLLDLDREMETLTAGCYMRFGDDILFLSRDSATARQGLYMIEKHIEDRGLTLNPAKSLQLSLGDPNQNSQPSENNQPALAIVSQFSYLGACIDQTGHISVPAAKIRPFRSYMRERIRAACRALPRDASPEIRLRIALCAAGNLLNSPTQDSPLRALLREPLSEQQLRELDSWLALLIQKAALRCGFKKGNFKRCPPVRLRKDGLPSLLHLKRTAAYA